MKLIVIITKKRGGMQKEDHWMFKSFFDYNLYYEPITGFGGVYFNSFIQ